MPRAGSPLCDCPGTSMALCASGCYGDPSGADLLLKTTPPSSLRLLRVPGASSAPSPAVARSWLPVPAHRVPEANGRAA